MKSIFFCWVNFLNDMYVYFSEKKFCGHVFKMAAKKKHVKIKSHWPACYLTYVVKQLSSDWCYIVVKCIMKTHRKFQSFHLIIFFTNSFFTIWPNYFQSLSMSPLSTSLCLYLPLSISLSLILDRNHFLVESVTHFTHCHSPYNRKTHYIPHQTHQNGPVDQIRHFGRA